MVRTINIMVFETKTQQYFWLGMCYNLAFRHKIPPLDGMELTGTKLVLSGIGVYIRDS